MIGAGRRKVPSRFSTPKSLIFGPLGRPDRLDRRGICGFVACGPDRVRVELQSDLVHSGSSQVWTSDSEPLASEKLVGTRISVKGK